MIPAVALVGTRAVAVLQGAITVTGVNAGMAGVTFGRVEGTVILVAGLKIGMSGMGTGVANQAHAFGTVTIIAGVTGTGGESARRYRGVIGVRLVTAEAVEAKIMIGAGIIGVVV